MTDRLRPSVLAIVAASALAAGGMLVHDVFEFGPAFLVDPQSLVPLGIFVILAILALRRTAGPGTWVALFTWGALNLVGGGILSVLPLGLLPFTPEQSLGHYGVHAVYALSEVPLVLVAWAGIRATRSGPPRGDARALSDVP